MKIVQTFWHGNNSLLDNSFGWMNPQYHLMSWALSCLSLKDNYQNIVLYTDSHGYEIFAEQLKLPYTDIIIQYDNLTCPEPHWAYPKLLTYSLQKEPFIHVDGDVYLPNKLDNTIEMSELIAQNKEIVSRYYKSMMNHILQKDLLMPSFLKKELEKDSIMSYNAGIIGGNDLEFIAEYCRTAFNFIESNHLNDINSKDIHINNNILFEQILFYAQSNSYNKPVATVLDHSVRDNGYIYDDFCNFYLYDKAKLLHIIGGHKKNQRICDLLSKTLLNKYPDYYNRVVELFANNHKRMQNKAKNTTFPDLSVQMCIASYQDYLHSLSKKWEKLSYTDLYDWEKCSSSYFMFLNAGKEEQAIFTINRNPYLSIYEIPEPWPTEAKKLLKERINKECHSDHFDIVCIPCLLYEGFKEVLINDLCYNILILIEEEKTFECLFNELLPCFSSEISKDKEQTYKLILTEVEYLLYHGVICIN